MCGCGTWGVVGEEDKMRDSYTLLPDSLRYVVQAKKDFKAAKAGKDMSQASRRHTKLLDEVTFLPSHT